MTTFEAVSFLIASVALTVAVRSHASSFRLGALMGVAHALLSFASAYALHGSSQYAERPLWLGLAWTVATLSSIFGLVVAGRAAGQAGEGLEREMARRARRAWIGLAWLEGAALVTAFERSRDGGFVVLGAYFVTPILFGVGALRLVRPHRRNHDSARAELARFMGLFWLSLAPLGVLSALVSLGGSNPLESAYGAGVGTFLLLLPLTTVVLVGVRSPPLELVNRPLSQEQWARQTTFALGALGVVAGLFVAASFAGHFGSCAGVLVTVPEPESAWRSLPVVAKGDWESLGPFRIRGYHVSYKTYPSGLGAAALSDPKLCFSSTVSLGVWFDESKESTPMYRLPEELELRHDPKTDTYVVSGSGYPRTDAFVVAFRRDEVRRYAFDYPEAKDYQVFGACSLVVGLLALVLFYRRARRPLAEGAVDRQLFHLLAYLAFLGALAAPCALAFHLVDAPRPGAELVVIHVAP